MPTSWQERPYSPGYHQRRTGDYQYPVYRIRKFLAGPF